MNRSLVDRGDLELWVDPRLLAAPRAVGAGAGRGRPYTAGVIHLAVVLGALYRLPLRQTEGLARSVARRVGGTAPSYSTICRRRRTLVWDHAKVRADAVLVIDATGISVTTQHAWMRTKHRDGRRAKFVKLHVGIDQQTGEVLSWEVTPGDGRGSGDVSVGPGLIGDAASRTRLAGVLADRAYDAASCYAAAERAGTRLTTPPRDNARRGLHPHRDEHLGQIGLLGPPRWKSRVGYGQRAQVESFFGSFKKIHGGGVRARSFEGQCAELGAQLELWNSWHR